MSPGSHDTLGEFLDRVRTAVDDALDRILPSPPACPPLLHEAMRYSLLSGGKRFRPALVLGAADAVAPGDAAAWNLALPAACALEMIHTYSLVHDDLPAMDNDTLRRGRPTSHVVYGDGLAILAGDGLLTEAFALMAREPAAAVPALQSRTLRAIGILAEAAGAAGMVGGQAIDLQAAGQCLSGPSSLQGGRVAPASLRLDEAGLRAMHARKTGALIRAAATVGAIMAGATPEAERGIAGYAADLGLAFQIVDDVLDVEGGEAALGKTAGKDAAAGKPTYVALFGVERARALAAEALERALASLATARLAGILPDLARWVVSRTH
jgi:geranylgeranyl diphosphate synthase type II